MMTFLKSILQQYKNIVCNSFFLSIVDGVRLLLPFVAMPYIIRVCGVENYGKIIFAQTVMTYFYIVVNFGLHIFSVREVAGNVHNPAMLSKIASNLIALRLLLTALSFIALIIMIAAIPFMQQFRVLLLLAFISVLAEAFNMTPFFQGLEKMHNIAILQFAAALFYLSTLCIFVRNTADYPLVVLLQSSGLLVSAILGVGLLCVKCKIRLQLPQWHDLKNMLAGSAPFAVSRISTIINNNISRLFAGISLGMHELALVDLAQKISDTALIPAGIVDQAIYPHNAKKQDRAFATRTFYLIIIFGAISAAVMIAGAPLAVNFLGSGKLNDAVPLIYWLGIKVFFSTPGWYMGTSVLVAFGYARQFNMYAIYSTAINLSIYTILFLCNKLTLNAVIAIMIFESIFAIIYEMYYCRKYNLLYITRRNVDNKN